MTPDQVHSWRVGLDASPEAFARLDATLTGDERSRSGRFRFQRDRRRFVVARGALRELMGLYLGIHPPDIHFVYNSFGKPELGPEFGGSLRFNLSHSADLALIAIAGGADLGVDLEYIRPQPDYAEIARRFFSAAEVARLNALPSHLHAEAFFSCWTKKEACVKARGEGLAMPLSSFSVPLTTDPAHASVDLGGRSDDAGRARRWSLHTLLPAPGYIGALAIEGDGWQLTERTWQVS